MTRVILHLDMDAFYASIEQRDNPALKGLPVIVGGPAKRGVVTTCSYEARVFGVHSAMPMGRAIRLCPKAVVVPGRMEVYQQVSEQIMAVLDEFSPTVEPLSLDEAFLDMTGCERLFGTPPAIAKAIKRRVLERTRLTSSIGIAANKFLAKLASDLDKPDGITWVPFGREKEFIAPLSVRKLWGVGPRTAASLERLGLGRIGDVAAMDPEVLRRRLGALGDHLHALANAWDDRPVIPERGRKSCGAETTLEEDIRGRGPVEAVLREQCQRAARHLRSGGFLARGVRVKLRYSEGFQLATRDGRIAAPCDDSASLFEAAAPLLDRLDLASPIRLVGVAAFDLVEPGEGVQLDLFAQRRAARGSKLEHTMDAIRSKFEGKIRRGAGRERR
jgi:DNA polymerase-4